ncbi:unnamed protein product [Paramecium pentaurelia]|uniref:Transmembrane protein n=1 Tax=Paramecium pentaurelia TaxID=43138 RepID=A0A8S1WJN5_9CILI|nr:unnamed protein product [Paramecium pentaurelia]
MNLSARSYMPTQKSISPLIDRTTKKRTLTIQELTKSTKTANKIIKEKSTEKKLTSNSSQETSETCLTRNDSAQDNNRLQQLKIRVLTEKVQQIEKLDLCKTTLLLKELQYYRAKHINSSNTSVMVALALALTYNTQLHVFQTINQIYIMKIIIWYYQDISIKVVQLKYNQVKKYQYYYIFYYIYIYLYLIVCSIIYEYIKIS